MEHEELQSTEVAKPKATNSSHVVMADSVTAEEVPTISLGDLQTIDALQPEVAVHSVASTQAVIMPTPLVVQPAEYHRSMGEWLRIWWDGMRPGYLTLSLMPVLLGSVLAWMPTVTTRTPLGTFHITHFLATIVAIFLLQTGAHLVNDYYDYLRGIDTGNTLGPGGLIQQGLIKPTRVLTIGLTFLVLGALLGIAVAMRGGPLVFLFGIIGLLCAYFYSASTYALSSLALGELVGFVIFGPLITMGAYMVQSGAKLAPDVFAYSLPLGLLAAAIISLNNLRDIEEDAQAGKRTLAAILGVKWSRILYLVLLLGAYVLLIAQGLPHKAPHLILITLWTLPGLVVAITGILRTDVTIPVHLVMRQTLRLQTAFALLLIVALIATTIVPVLPFVPLKFLNI